MLPLANFVEAAWLPCSRRSVVCLGGVEWFGVGDGDTTVDGKTCMGLIMWLSRVLVLDEQSFYSCLGLRVDVFSGRDRGWMFAAEEGLETFGGGLVGEMGSAFAGNTFDTR